MLQHVSGPFRKGVQSSTAEHPVAHPQSRGQGCRQHELLDRHRRAATRQFGEVGVKQLRKLSTGLWRFHDTHGAPHDCHVPDVGVGWHEAVPAEPLVGGVHGIDQGHMNPLQQPRIIG